MADREATKDLTAAAQVRKLYEDNQGIWSPYWDAMTREEAFLEGDRFLIDKGQEQKDQRLAQIRGQEIQDTIRHIVAEATSRPRSAEARPTDQDSDPYLAEVDLALVEGELRDPWKGFESRLYEAIQSAREMRLGVVWMDWDPDCGEYGEILYNFVDPRRIMWDSSYDPHHPCCGWVLIKRRFDVDWIHENYKGSDWVKPDYDRIDTKTRRQIDGPILGQNHGPSLVPQNAINDNKAELWFCWYKNDRTPAYRDLDTELEFDPGERYMACQNGCGYRSPTQDQLIEQGKIETELPEEVDGCPLCEAVGQNGILKRIDAKADQEEVLAYTRGKRLVVIAPYCASPDDKPVYDGKWPIPTARSFPGLFITCYVKAGKPIGASDVKLMWDQQYALDTLDTIAIQRVYEHRAYWEMPGAGINDMRGQRFAFKSGQNNLMFRDQSKATMGSLEVNVHNGTGLDPSYAIVRDRIAQRLTQYRGVADFGLTPESSKDITAETARTLERQGNIPLEDFRKRVAMELSKMYGVLSDMIHATYTPKRIKRLNIEGADLALKLWGEDMPRFDYTIEESPPFTGLDKARAEAAKYLMSIMTNPQTAPFADLLAEVNNLPRGIVRKFERRMQQLKDQAEQEAYDQQSQIEEGQPVDELGQSGAGIVPEPENTGVIQ